MAANDEIRDQLLAHQIDLFRFGDGMTARIRAILNRAEPELRAVIRTRMERTAALGYDPGPVTTRRMVRTSTLIRDTNRATFQEINALVRSELVGLSVGETEFIAKLIEQELPVAVGLTLPAANELRGIVFARPFERRILRDWLRSFEFGDRRRMMDEIRQGLVFGETPTDIGKRIFGTRALGGTDGVREITRRGAQALAQTSISAISNATRQLFYLRNRRFMRREQFVATLDSRTTPICSSLDGDVFKVGEGPIPPLHINCRSIRVPVIDGRKLGRRPAVRATERQLRGLRGPARRRAVEKLVGTVPADQTYVEFLRNSTTGFQNEVLGPTRGRLFRAGEIDLKGFVDNSGTRFTLRELYDRDPAVFQRVGIPAPAAPGVSRPALD